MSRLLLDTTFLIDGERGEEPREDLIAPSDLMTDEYSAYKKPGQQFAAHHTVNHAQGKYGRGAVTTNTTM